MNKSLEKFDIDETIDLHKYYINKTEPKEKKTTPIILNNNIVSEYQDSAQVSEYIDNTKDYLANRLCDDLIGSFDKDWYKNNSFSEELENYLDEISINTLIRRLRYDSIIHGDAFCFPFEDDVAPNRLNWINSGQNQAVWKQRFIDEYVAMSIFFVPISGVYERSYIVSFFPNTILTAEVTINQNVSGNTSLKNSGFSTNFRYYDISFNQKPFDFNNQLIILNWKQNQEYTSLFDKIYLELKVYAIASVNLINDLQFSGSRLYVFEDAGEERKNKETIDYENYLYRNNKIIRLSKQQSLTNPSAIGNHFPTLTASNYEADLIVKERTWREIVNKVNLFNVTSTKGSAQQHSAEILIQNLHAVVEGRKRIDELKIILIKWINLIVKIKGFKDAILTHNVFKFEYKFPILDLIAEITDLTNPTPTNNITPNSNSNNNDK